jgi:hypothetical protein
MSEFKPQSWIMRVRANPKKVQFDLEGAIRTSLYVDRTMWLSNGQHGKELRIGDRVYLWSSGVRTEDGSIGRLIGLATVEEGSQPHPHHDWQAEFRRSGNYNPDTRRIKLFVEALVEPAVTRFQLLKVYPEATAKTAFFRNGHRQTTARVEATSSRHPPSF